MYPDRLPSILVWIAPTFWILQLVACQTPYPTHVTHTGHITVGAILHCWCPDCHLPVLRSVLDWSDCDLPAI